jgi:signal transduction histidine kinase/ActR/RegA family two-component response regulator
MTSVITQPRFSSDSTNRLRAEQVKTLFKNVAPGVLGAGAGNIVLEIILVHLNSISAVSGVIWFLFMMLCVSAHLCLLYLYRKAQPDEHNWKPWATVFTAISFLEGAGWGWASVFLNDSHRVDIQLIIVNVTLVVATGAIPAFGSYFPAFIALFIPASFPYMILAIVTPDPVLRTTGFLMPVFIITMGALGIQTARNFKELVELRIKSGELAGQLQIQKELAEQANVAKSHFLAAASHDLRQPVHAIGLFVGALRAVQLPSEALRLLQQIDTSVAALDSLFSALLDISRLDAGVVEVRKQSFMIQPLLNRICNDYVEMAKAKSISVVRRPCSARVLTDPILLERIIRNLVSNAVRYTRRGRIVVGCRRSAGAIRVEVWDTGVGIPKALQERVFQEYFQLENPERDREKGLGLGLAIVRRLVNLLDCPLSLRSGPGRGSCFSVTLPRALDAHAPLEAQKENETQEKGRGLIAVIDDEAPIREAMATLLNGWGYTVVSAGSGDEILRKLATCPVRPDLIISDYRLRANENGIEVIGNLQSEFNEAIPAMLITGDTARERLEEAKASGLVLLHKPVANSKLRAAIVNLTAASRHDAEL